MSYSMLINCKRYEVVLLGISKSWSKLLDKEEVRNILFRDKKIPKHFIWDIMEGSIDGALFLKRFKIFLDFKMKFIQFGVDMYPRLYWKNIRPDNTHRYYYRYFFKGELIKAYYSP